MTPEREQAFAQLLAEWRRDVPYIISDNPGTRRHACRDNWPWPKRVMTRLRINGMRTADVASIWGLSPSQVANIMSKDSQ